MEEDILSLVLDGVQVVSYKWLSRKFSISSNEAKRLLQIIADQHDSTIEVIYAVSGWSKTNEKYYSVQLVPKSKLHEATGVLDGHVSVHVYSIQRSIPKDPAELWAAEYAQSHELFEQDPELSSCLRDNRFSAVTCPSISRKGHRSSDSGQKDVSKTSFISNTLSKGLVKQEEVPIAVGIPKCGDKQDNSKSMEKPVLKPTSREENNAKASETRALVHGSSANVAESKEINMKKGEGGGIANLWGRASVKPKQVSAQVHVESAVKVEVQEEEKAQAHAHAHDVSLGESSEDDATDFMHVRRGQTKQTNGRMRRMVIDDEMSDDEEDDSQNIVSLSSPDVPIKTKPCFLLDTITPKKKRKKDKKDSRSSPEIDPPPLHQNKKQAGDSSLGTNNVGSHTEPKVKEERNSMVKRLGSDAKAEKNLPPQLTTKNGASSIVQSVGKKRKVLKTHIDDHGREVTEVVWENDSDGANSEDKMDVTANINAHADASSKVPDNKTFGNKEPHKPSSNKTVSSNTKAGKGVASKDSQQGKIFSFFKKKT